MSARCRSWSRPALVALVAAIAAFGLEADAGTDQLVDNDSDAFVATEEFKREFGDDAVVVLVKGDLEQLVLTSDLGDAALARGLPLGQRARAGRCSPTSRRRRRARELAETKPARVVYGPATFLNQFAIQAGKLLQAQTAGDQRAGAPAAAAAAIDARRQGLSTADQRAAGAAAAQEVQDAFQQQLLTLGTRLRAQRGAAARRPDLRQLGGLRQPHRRRSRSPASPTSSRAPSRR